MYVDNVGDILLTHIPNMAGYMVREERLFVMTVCLKVVRLGILR